MPDYQPIYGLTIDGYDGNALRILSFDGFEGLSQLFHFNIAIASDSALDFDSIVGKKATFTIQPDPDQSPRYVQGIIARIEEGEPSVRYTTYRLTLVPKAWRLQHRADIRIFQSLTATAIIEAVLKGAGLASGDDYTLSLQGTYTTREYCVQYRESDWDFVCRLMEEEGIIFFFEHDEEKHKLTIIDAVAGYPVISGDATLNFRMAQGALGTIEHGTHVSRFVYAQEVRPGKVTVRDFDFAKPALLLESKQAASVDADLEIYDYPGSYVVPADGDAIAAKRLVELQASLKTGDGDSTCPRFLAGHTFTLADHPREAFNASYLLARVEHRGHEPATESIGDEAEQETPYANTFEIVPAKVLLRPPRVTRKPLIHGAQTAIVVGPANEEIYTDESGRVKVQFHWDRLGKKDDKSSCWMRVSQPWAGPGFGGIFIPRINDEVVITFLEGDPDRPLIVGRVYHGTNVPPYPLPANKTVSTIKTHSSAKGAEGASNELRFEDKKGAEEIYVHGQRDYTIKIEKDKAQRIGHDESLDVKHNFTKHVGHNETKNVDHDHTVTIGHNRATTIKHDESVAITHSRTTTIGVANKHKVGGNETLEVDKDQTLLVKGKQSITVNGTQTIEVDDDHKETLKGNVTQAITKDRSVTVDGKSTEKVTGDVTETYSGKLTLSVTSDYATTVNGKTTLTSSQDVSITCGAGKITISPAGEITVQGVQITVKGDGPVSVQGAQVEVKATAMATVQGPMVQISGDSMVQVKGGMVMIQGQVMAG